VRPAAHVVEHVPFEHRSPLQLVPHIPQFKGSDGRFAQVMPHALKGAVHVHWPLVQLWPDPQTLPHMPQLRKSVASVVQFPKQLV
jgi:hypothetical protein